MQTSTIFNELVPSVFLMALSTNRPFDSSPVNQAEVARDVETLYRAGQAKLGTDEVRFLFAQVDYCLNLRQMAFCEILINRSQPHIAAV